MPEPDFSASPKQLSRYADFETSPASLAEQLAANLSILTPEQSQHGLDENGGLTTEICPPLDHRRGGSEVPPAVEVTPRTVDPLVEKTPDRNSSRGDSPLEASGDGTPVDQGAPLPVDEASVPSGTSPVATNPAQVQETPALEVIQEVHEQAEGKDESPAPPPFLLPEEPALCTSAEERSPSEDPLPQVRPRHPSRCRRTGPKNPPPKARRRRRLSQRHRKTMRSRTSFRVGNATRWRLWAGLVRGTGQCSARYARLWPPRPNSTRASLPRGKQVRRSGNKG